MPITDVIRDPGRLTLTVVADFAVPRERLWDAYLDPRQIERFWGPPGWPAMFLRHDGSPGGRSLYRMIGPDGDSSSGYWEWIAVDAPRFFEVKDGFANQDGSPDIDMPDMRMIFEFSDTVEGSRLTTTTYFNSEEELEQLIGMGMEEGMRSAMSQIDAVVEDLSTFAAGRRTEAHELGERQVRISRIIRGSIEQVWLAHHEPELLQKWMLGPDGWTMPICQVAQQVGDSFRYEWENIDGQRFGFTGRLIESISPWREVTTEAMIGVEETEALNELTLVPVSGGTLLTLVIAYPDAETRRQALGTGMVDGMEKSYARLERKVLGE